jgi:hypothetical protein
MKIILPTICSNHLKLHLRFDAQIADLGTGMPQGYDDMAVLCCKIRRRDRKTCAAEIWKWDYDDTCDFVFLLSSAQCGDMMLAVEASTTTIIINLVVFGGQQPRRPPQWANN